MRPVVICCSQRFKNELEGFVGFLEKRGVTVLSPNFRHHRKTFIQKSEEQRLKSASYRNKVPGLVHAHFDNIYQVARQGGICLIFNPLPAKGQRRKYGYVGSNTQAEIGYAHARGVPVLLMKPHEEEWVMTVVHSYDRKRIFSLMHPKTSPLDFDVVYEWLKGWIQ